MQESILLTELECGNNGDVYSGCSNTINDISTENLLDEIKWKYIPNNGIELKVTDTEIQNWLKTIKEKKNTIDFDELKFLTIAIVQTDGGYDEYEIEYLIEETEDGHNTL